MHPENLIKMIRKQALFKVDKIEFKANISTIQIKIIKRTNNQKDAVLPCISRASLANRPGRATLRKDADNYSTYTKPFELTELESACNREKTLATFLVEKCNSFK